MTENKNAKTPTDDGHVAHVYLFEKTGRPMVAWDNAKDIKLGDRLYTAPKQWVGLTEDEIWQCNKAKSGAVEFHICFAHQNVEDFAESIEAKLKEKNMSDSYDDYEAKIQLAEHEWEMVKTEHDKQIEIAQAYERGWNAALAQQEPVAWPDDMLERINAAIQRITSGQGCNGCMRVPPDKTDPDLVLADIRKLIKSSQPASKPWVGLTDEEIQDLSHLSQKIDQSNETWFDRLGFARAVEQALKEKNHG